MSGEIQFSVSSSQHYNIHCAVPLSLLTALHNQTVLNTKHTAVRWGREQYVIKTIYVITVTVICWGNLIMLHWNTNIIRRHITIVYRNINIISHAVQKTVYQFTHSSSHTTKALPIPLYMWLPQIRYRSVPTRALMTSCTGPVAQIGTDCRILRREWKLLYLRQDKWLIINIGHCVFAS